MNNKKNNIESRLKDSIGPIIGDKYNTNEGIDEDILDSSDSDSSWSLSNSFKRSKSFREIVNFFEKTEIPIKTTKKIYSEGIGWWEEPSHHRHETWFELFQDLVMVAAALQFGSILGHSIDILALFEGAVLFGVLRSSWDEIVIYNNLYYTNDILHSLYELAEALTLFSMILNLSTSHDHHTSNHTDWDRENEQQAYALSAACIRIFTVIMYLQVLNQPKSKYKGYIKGTIISHLFSALLLAISAFTSTSSILCFIFWILALIVERPLLHLWAKYFLKEEKINNILNNNNNSNDFHNFEYKYDDENPNNIEDNNLIINSQLDNNMNHHDENHKKNMSNIWPSYHVDHIVARHGTFVMLILGEGVIQLVLAESSKSFHAYSRAFIGFALLFNVGDIYYEHSPEKVSKHALNSEKGFGWIWLALHSPLNYSNLLLCISIKNIYHNPDSLKKSWMWLLCVTASISLTLTFILRLSHKGFQIKRKARRNSYLARFFISLFCILIPLFTDKIFRALILLFLITTILIIFDLFSRRDKHDNEVSNDYIESLRHSLTNNENIINYEPPILSHLKRVNKKKNKKKKKKRKKVTKDEINELEKRKNILKKQINEMENILINNINNNDENKSDLYLPNLETNDIDSSLPKYKSTLNEPLLKNK